MNSRTATCTRETAETRVSATLNLDGRGESRVNTGIGFLDHLLETLARHSCIDLEVTCSGDLQVDDHHTAEDTAIILGRAISQALGERRGIARFGYACAPLDEALARAVVDISGRPYARVALGLRRDMIGGLACENVAHVISSLATAGALTVHVEVLYGDNDHHRAEAAFKALALALRQALARDDRTDVPSTKGTLT